MHKNKKAWFSESVSRHICDLWVTEGGIITNWCSADFLFSNDAAHPDTQRIFESLDFVEDKATVFHASYLSACEDSGLNDSVAMGHFLLPPSCLHEEIRAAVGNFIWELDNPLQPQQSHERGDASKRKRSANCHHPEMEKIDQDIHNNGRRNQNLGIETPSFEATTCHVQQMYPVNNMVTGFISIDELKKYPGDLYDFIPGSAGYSVCCAHRDKIFSVLKSRNRNHTFIHTN
ncbi:telomere repeats-binding bouquet formation protein 2 isoform X2 [Chiloscyllium plagiosum]|uniref:telomere repeats-binding bouquet formation protein 2 isoform X2 n=1 Tax=Chiloscyllium plagiosum TaxID=36176 RepID=UPI001CB837C3|nr:telomere repeats-binding bouquet formation protein 2 isoform X2 [Chiloscyllium plagiosum]